MEESLYDEFGNYIGPELRSSDEEDSGSESESERSENSGRGDNSDGDEVRFLVVSHVRLHIRSNIIMLSA